MAVRKPIKFSILIPVLNGEATLSDCLDAVFRQTLSREMEVIIVDSGSNDNTLEILKAYQIRFYQIKSTSFNHGLTRNYAVSLAKGEFVIFTVQDAIPSDEQWIEKLHKHFEDPQVAAVCGKQVVPHDRDKNPHEWSRPQSEPCFKKIYFDDPIEFENLSPADKRKVCALDNVNTMYRNDVLNKIPFRKTFFAEDMIWAKEALKSGHAIIFDDRPSVEHYHYATFSYQLKRTFTVLYHQYILFNFDPGWKFSNLEFLKVIYRNFKYGASFKWVIHQWQRMLATRRAYKYFRSAKSIGITELGEMHNIICSRPPQGFQKIK